LEIGLRQSERRRRSSGVSVRGLAAWLLLAAWGAIAAAASPSRAIDESRVRAAGIRKLESKRLTLYTDLPPSAAVEELPEAFDQAFPQWCAYFGVETGTHADWRMTGYLIKDKLRFEAAGLLPRDLPPFLNGFSRQRELWLYDQTSDYYRRHLLLHEGTHGFMATVLRGCGPPWYSEGMAELLATHRWQRGHLRLNSFPANPADVSKLGRIELVETDLANGRGHTLPDVLAYDSRAHLKVEPYAWSWAAVAFLDNHPRYRERFRELWRLAGDANFNKRFAEKFAADGARLVEEFQVFAGDLAYGYDFSRTAIDFTPGKPLAGPAKLTVAADQGWQNTGLKLEAGKAYRFTASGRFQVGKSSRVWWSEPEGVSIHYVHGRTLGLLLGAVRPDEMPNGESPLAAPLKIGMGTTIRPDKTGTLFLRTNISSGELGAAAGSLAVEVARE
jgi:hypothetical protein